MISSVMCMLLITDFDNLYLFMVCESSIYKYFILVQKSLYLCFLECPEYKRLEKLAEEGEGRKRRGRHQAEVKPVKQTALLMYAASCVLEPRIEIHYAKHIAFKSL